jgi:hypothetical protein
MVTSVLEPVDVVVHSQEFRVHARLHMRPGSSSAWLLNTEDRSFLSLTDASMYRPTVSDPPPTADLLFETRFAAVPKTHVSWMVGGAPDTGQDGYGRQPRQVYVMYPSYLLTGLFHMRAETRLSDFLATITAAKPFQTLFDAAILEPGPAGTRVEQWRVLQRHAFVTVNLRLSGGVFDVRSPRDERPRQVAS